MITTIIVTVVSTVFFVLVLGYFIWSGIKMGSMRKSIKDLISKNVDLKKEIDNNDENLMSYIDDNNRNQDEQQHDTNIKFSDIYNENNRYREEQNRDLDIKISDIYNEINTLNEKMHVELDKRFNNVYEKIEAK